MLFCFKLGIMKKIKYSLHILAELTKVRITFLVALTTLAGYVLAKGKIDVGLFLPVLGIFLLACGSGALNHVQDSDRDGLMARTRKRPIPSGKISKAAVMGIVLILTISGSVLLYLGSAFEGMWLGILAMIWYNGIYTPLKRVTAYAVIPGSVIGSLPPLVGWVAAGGVLWSWQALVIAWFFFVWQVPHFWLLMIHYGDEYIQAGYPSITQRHSVQHIRYQIFAWTLTTVLSALLFPLTGMIHSAAISLLMAVLALWLLGAFLGLLKRADKLNPFYYFMRINYFVLLIIIAIALDAYLS